MIWEDIIFIRIFREIWFIRRAWNERVKSWLTRASLKKKQTLTDETAWRTENKKPTCGRADQVWVFSLTEKQSAADWVTCSLKYLERPISCSVWINRSTWPWVASCRPLRRVQCRSAAVSSEELLLNIILGVQVRAASIDLSCFNVGFFLFVFLNNKCHSLTGWVIVPDCGCQLLWRTRVCRLIDWFDKLNSSSCRLGLGWGSITRGTLNPRPHKQCYW